MTSTEVTITSKNAVSVVSIPMGGVRSVNGQHGDVTLLADDIPITDAGDYYTATDIEGALQEIGAGGIGGGGGTAATTTFTPTGTISSTDVQAAVAEVSGDVTAEASARASADTTLQTNITSEASTRATADTTLQTNITAEASTRATADTTNATAISTEASARATADALLAPKASPTFTGVVTIPSTSVLGTPASLTLTNATGLPEAGVVNLTSDLALKAPLASPTFTGTVTVPSPSAGTSAANKSYVDGLISTVPTFRGVIDCSTNPNYPSATGGDSYVVSVAGKIGGASGKSVVAGDVVLASATNAGGTEASVGTSWIVLHSGTGAALTSGTLAQFAATTSAQLASVMSDETGTGALVFGTSPTLVTPALGTPSALTLTNATGLPQTGVTSLVTDLANRHKIGLDITWDGNSARTGLATDGVVNQDTASLAGTAVYHLPDSTDSNCYDNQIIVITDRAGGASNATPMVITTAAGSSDTITNSFYGPSLIGVFTAFGSATMRLDKPNKVWTAVNVFLDPDASMSSPSDAVASTQAAMVSFVGDTVAGLDTVSGGTNILATETAGNVTFDLASDVDLPQTSFFSSTLIGGKVGASNLSIAQTYTQTADPVSGDHLGSPIYVNWNPTLNYTGGAFVGELVQDGWFGPLGTVAVTGTVTYTKGSTAFGLAPLGITQQLVIRNAASTALNYSPAWGMMNGHSYIADGATVTLNTTDVNAYGSGLKGGAAFIDTDAFVTMNTGTINGSTNNVDHCSFMSLPIMGGNTHLKRRIAFYADEIQDNAGAFMANLFLPDGDVTDTDALVIDENIGFIAPRYRVGTTNYAAKFDGAVSLWSDTNTFAATSALGGSRVTTQYNKSTQPGMGSGSDMCAFGITGTHTLDYAAPSVQQIYLGGTWTFKQVASIFGAMSSFKASPTISNHSSLSGTVISVNSTAALGPTYAMDATAGNIVLSDIRGLNISPTFSRSAGSNSVTATLVRHINIASALSNATITTEVGIDIAALTGTTKWGIRNVNNSVLGGTIYGSEASGGAISLGPTSHATKGDINLTGPYVHLISDNQTIAGSSNYYAMRQDNTITMGASGGAGSTGNGYVSYYHTPTVVFSAAGNVLGGVRGFVDGGTYKNQTTTNTSPGPVTSFSATPTINADAGTYTIAQYVGFASGLTLSRTTSGGPTITNVYQFQAAAVGVTANTTVLNHYGFHSTGPTINTSAANMTLSTNVHLVGPTIGVGRTLSTRTGISIQDSTAAGATLTSQYGIDIANLSAGTGNVAIRVQGTSAPVIFNPKTTLGGSTAPTWNAHIQGGNSATTGLGLDVSTTGPTAPSSNASGVVSVYKGATNYYLLVTFNDAGTTRYKYMQLNGTGTTWTAGTTLPT